MEKPERRIVLHKDGHVFIFHLYNDSEEEKLSALDAVIGMALANQNGFGPEDALFITEKLEIMPEGQAQSVFNSLFLCEDGY